MMPVLRKCKLKLISYHWAPYRLRSNVLNGASSYLVSEYLRISLFLHISFFKLLNYEKTNILMRTTFFLEDVKAISIILSGTLCFTYHGNNKSVTNPTIAIKWHFTFITSLAHHIKSSQ